MMILVPGRDAVSLDLVRVARRFTVAFVVLPLLIGAAAQRCWDLARDAMPRGAMGSLQRAVSERVQPRRHPALVHASTALPVEPRYLAPEQRRGAAETTIMTALRPATLAGFEVPGVISVKAIIQSLTAARRRSKKRVDPAVVPINGVLRLQALHLGETLSARPFDDLLRPDPRAFSDVNHLMRCRVTGNEVEMDPRLVGILAQLSTIYGRTLQLVSGHRAPLANGTSPTSQHTLGRAADIRIPGVRIDDLRKVAIKLGARGVGIYPDKGFVHIDVRDKQRYYWQYTARGGEQADLGSVRPSRAGRPAPDEETATEGAGEEPELGAASPEHAPAAEHEHVAEPAAEPHEASAQ